MAKRQKVAEPEYSLQRMDLRALSHIIYCAMEKLVDELENETLDPRLDIRQWVDRFVHQHVWDLQLMLSDKKKEALDSLKFFINRVVELPQHARLTPINHDDITSILSVIVFLFQDDLQDDAHEH